MKKLRIILPFLILFAASCSTPQNLVYKGVSGLYVSALSLDRTAIGADVLLYNPNPFPLQLKSADLDVFINNRPLGKAVLDKRITIPARDSVAVPVALQAGVKDLFNGVLRVITKSEATVKIAGTVKAGRGIVSVRVPVRYEGKQKLDF